jgi:hypothetical protein
MANELPQAAAQHIQLAGRSYVTLLESRSAISVAI